MQRGDTARIKAIFDAYTDAYSGLVQLYFKYDDIITSKNDPRAKILVEIGNIIMKCNNKTDKIKHD